MPHGAQPAATNPLTSEVIGASLVAMSCEAPGQRSLRGPAWRPRDFEYRSRVLLRLCITLQVSTRIRQRSRPESEANGE